jgi:hypothetical protein
MLAAGGNFQTLISVVEPGRFISAGIAASAIGHLSALTMVLLLAEVRPFGSVTAEPIAVDIVSPAEAAPPANAVPSRVTPTKAEEPVPTAQPAESFDLSSKPAASGSPAPAAAPEAASQLQQPSPPSPTYIAPEPDLSIKYHVMLGLPQDMTPSLPQAGSDAAFDEQASKAADIASSLVTEFRRRLKACSKLPATVAPSDRIKIKLRVFMTPDGRLAAEPILIEASASAKGPALMQSAISALQACQPYAMLPVDRYGEWKVLDLSFTPADFTGAS